MNYIVKLLSLLGMVLLSMACMKEERDVVRHVEMIVASKYTTCEPSYGVKVPDCLIVTEAKNNNNTYYLAKSEITGFSYELGFEYRILVKATKLANPPMDSGDTEFELIKVISKTKVN
ncbi:hypothetical protein HMPREF0765_1068 [Sphingobacterium spiritivorum ATCC 33300]|uniref:DUF4377 domain-containing protein n=1 Tax=Sphingobacterium spiritivorum ATCC 33300 TaxID=525372 RepID=C2FUR2_SPHSI|nr:DUF4377 domain-containing protein [Sphingobacterium spiritivorum]EEI93266.1 hypothetical protein HMPREF0765_1068 [Sphingobacterium spiritivorum ATCC 33300]QQS95968.1 DUF4377 domain-containing protein [Sphingobacterium spiritivorum]